jgi:prepilin peptidase CpaA
MGRRVREEILRYIFGIAAMAAAVFFVYTSWPQPCPNLIVSTFFLLICTTDTFYSKIPNLINLALVITALLYHGYNGGLPGLWFSLQGLLLGLALLLIPYMLGGMGAGDVKALAALGSFVGLGAIFQVFLFTALIGGIFAILYYALSCNLMQKCRAWLTVLKLFLLSRDHRFLKPAEASEPLRFPYAAAIALGFFIHVLYGKALWQVIIAGQ